MEGMSARGRGISYVKVGHMLPHFVKRLARDCIRQINLCRALFLVSNQAVTTESLPAKTSVLCTVVRLGVLIEDCCDFQDVNF